MTWHRYLSTEHVLSDLIGRTVTAIHWSEDRIVLETDDGPRAYYVDGDCCSHSYFHDFFGVEHLLNNGPVTEVDDVDLADDDPRFSEPVSQDDYEEIKVYGYRLTTVHPVFGEVSSVLSFRNSSNGYYGGSMDRDTDTAADGNLTQLTTDFIGA